MAANSSFTGCPQANASSRKRKYIDDVAEEHEDEEEDETPRKRKHRRASAFSDDTAVVASDEEGDEIPSELEAAMSSALVHIAIFSKNYAQSPWCLAELSFMLKTRTTIIPVFYGVEPSDLRWVAEGKGEYVDAFVKHEQKGRYTVEKLAEWKNALHQISFRNGYVVNNNDEEGELVLNKIVNDVLKIHEESLRRLRYHSTEALGIEYKISAVIKLLQFDDDKPAVGVIVYGIGGAGKTTLANEVYATLNLKGWKHSKVTLIKNMESHPNIEELQTQILSELTGKKHDTVKDYQSGQQELKCILETGDVFVYIDNILSKEHLENLLPKKINSQGRVRILATARKNDASVVFECCGVTPCELYPIESLPVESALELLCRKIDRGREINSIVDERPQTREIAEKCNCCPLFLEVVGAYLHKRHNEIEAYEKVFGWLSEGEAFSGYKEDRFDESRILFAYHELEVNAQEAFLDICSFFSDWEWDEVACIVGDEELQCLQEGALVKRIEVEDYFPGYSRSKREVRRISIHDLILIAGRNKSKGNRFRSADDFSMALENDKDLGQAKGVWLESAEISAGQLDAMSNSLRVFAMGDETIVRGQCCKQFDKLRFLQVGEVPNLAIDILKLKHLKFMDYVWSEDANNWSPPELPAEFGMLSSLTKLVLDSTSLQELPRDFQNLSALQSLHLSCCSSLVRLPCDFQNLSALQSLDLSGCSSLVGLPEGLGDLKSVTYVNVKGCSKLITLPDRVPELSLLKGEISFHGCRSLQEIPEEICKLTMLTSLTLYSCESLKVLPIGFGRVTCLEKLGLDECHCLQELCNDFHSLVRLRRLDMSGCHSLSRLPPSFGKLGSLEELKLSACDKLEELSSDFGLLGALKYLTLSRCESLSKLSDSFGQLGCLEQLDISRCSKLAELSSDFNCLKSVVRLELSKCKRLDGKWMDIVRDIQGLWCVDISGSGRMIRRWTEMRREEEKWHFVVITDSDRSSQRTEEENNALVLKAMISKIFDEEGLLVYIDQRPFHSFSLQSHPPLVLIIQIGSEKIKDGELFEKNVQQLEWSSKAWRIIYVGGEFNALPDEVKDRILAYTSPNKYSLFIHKFEVAFPFLDWGSTIRHIAFPFLYWDHTIVFRSRDGLEEKCPSLWEDISYIVNDDLVSLMRAPRASNFEILRALLNTDFLLLKNSQKVPLTDLQGKVVLLLYGSHTLFEHCYLSFEDVYAKMLHSNPHLVEVVSIPSCGKWGELEIDIEDAPWPVVPDPTSEDIKREEFFELLEPQVVYPKRESSGGGWERKNLQQECVVHDRK
ncbi:hypothetical protein KI387_034664, partial [Taxus chinensis]